MGYNNITLIKKKSFLLWVLRGRIKNVLEDMTSSISYIESKPKKVFESFTELRDDNLEKYLAMLNHVGQDDKENIDELFEKYKYLYNQYLSG